MSVPWWPIPGCGYVSALPGLCLHEANHNWKCTPWNCPVNHTHRMPFKSAMVAARRDPVFPKDITRRVIACSNSTVDGARWSAKDWARLDLERAFPGTITAENPTPYLLVPTKQRDTVHAVRPIYQPGDLILFGEELERCEGDGAALTAYSYDKALAWVDPEVAGFYGWSIREKWRLVWPWQRANQPAVFCPVPLARDQAVVIAAGPVRLQDITQDEALREGVSQKLAYELGYAASASEEEFNRCQARRVFKLLWDSINGERCPWKENRFVWRIEATRWGQLKEVFGK